MKAIIVGAGIGGLTTALSLHQFGWQVQIIERSNGIDEVGAGIQISPNAMRVFEKLGIHQEIENAGLLPNAIEMRLGISGLRLLRSKLQEVCLRRYGASYIHIHRADLISVLVDFVKKWMPKNSIQLNATFKKYELKKDKVEVTLNDGQSISGNLLIGADGIHSAVRSQMLGSEKPTFTGNVAWRCVVPVEKLGDTVPDSTACIWIGKKQHAVTYLLRGGTLANLVAIVEQKEWMQEEWNIESSKKDALKFFENWHPSISNTIKKSERIYKWALFDRQPLPKWSDGNVVLLGDSAHPMLPFLAQGGAMAIEDSWVLANCFSANDSIEKSLTNFYRKRIKRTKMIQQISRENGILFHQSPFIKRLIMHSPIWIAGKLFPRIGVTIHDRIFAYDKN